MSATSSPVRALGRVGLFAAVSAMGLSACAGLPAYSPARRARTPEAYATRQAFAAPVADWPIDHWWTGYGDPQLDRLEAEALANSPTLAQAEARVRKARAAAAQARGAELPRLSASAAAEETKQSYHLGIPPQFVPQGYNDYGRLALDFSWELDFWGKNRAAVAAATSEARAAAADMAEARLMLSTGVAAAYADLARLYADRDVAERTLAAQRESADLVRRRVAEGLDNQGELRQAEAQPLQAEADLAALDEQISLTRDRLAALIGEGPDRGLQIARPKSVSVKAFGLPPDIPAHLLGRRPDVTAARWRAEAAQRRVGEARAAFYPDVNLAGFIGYQALHLDALFKDGSDVGQIGPALTLPIFEGGRLRAGLRGAEADRDSAVSAYDATVTEALRQVADAVASERALATELAASRKALAASEDAYRIARLRYRGGLSTYTTLLQVEQQTLARRRATADLEARAFTLDVALVRALGGGFRPS